MNNEDKKRCGICEISDFERNNYFYGKLMTVRDFFAEQRYFNEKRWLINRMINGWGVVCGLDVYESEGKVFVSPGLAIDCCGGEILVCEKQKVPLKPEESECHTKQTGQEREVENLVICIEYQDCKTEALHFPPIACDQKEKCEFNRIRDSFKIRVRPKSEVDLVDPYGKYCPLTENYPGSLHDYLCEMLRKGCPECPERPCLVLAEVTITPSSYPNNSPIIEIDQCSKRKLVYSNPLLYDLIDCFHGDLPHISEITWEGLHAKEDIDWEIFKELVNKGLTVTFDKPMDLDTINRHTFLFAAITVEEVTGYRRLKYIPSSQIVKEKITISGKWVKTKATFVVEDDERGWKSDELTGIHSEIRRGADFEIILRGSLIMSMEGKALDGDFIGGNLPSGNGFQGGDFVSWFSVKPRPEEV